MKIIAKASKEEFLVTMTRGELDRLIDFDRCSRREFLVGHEINVNPMFDLIKGFLVHEYELKAIVTKLKSAAYTFDVAHDFIETLVTLPEDDVKP